MKTNKERIEMAATTIYAKHYKRGIPAKVMLKILKAEGIKFREIDCGEDFLGALIKNPNGSLYLFVNKSISNEGRKNFTIAHEFGHYTLQHLLTKSSFYCTENEIFCEDNISAQESEANCFANYYLLPRDRVRNEFCKWHNWRFKGYNKNFLFVNVENKKSYSDWKAISGKLTKMFDVSMITLKICLVELGLINNF